MSNEYFDKVAEKIGFESLNVEIVDGKFIITPSDAGLLIFAHLDIAEKQLVEREKDIMVLQNDIEEVREDNALVRDLLDRCYGVLTEVGQHGLAEEVLAAAYQVKGVEEFKQVDTKCDDCDGCDC
jgi:hypothetical protein